MSGNPGDLPSTPNSDRNYRLVCGESVSLRADTNAFAALDQIVRDGVRAFPKRGLEVAGTLTGSARDDEIQVDAIQPLPLEYRTAPAFRPSPSDLLVLKRSVASMQSDGAEVIGHFRSHTSGEPHPGDVDDTIADLLNIPEPILVLIPASAAGVDPAQVYVRVNREWTLLLSCPLTDSTIEKLQSAPVEEPWSDTPPALSLKAPRWRWPTVAGCAIGLLAGVLLGHSVWRTVPPPTVPNRSGINLSAQPSEGGIRVQWNPQSLAVSEGFSGVLTVQDGDRRMQIPLDRGQLRTGAIFYYPESGWAEIRLEIYRDGRHYNGETVALATGLAPAQAGRNNNALAANNTNRIGEGVSAGSPEELEQIAPSATETAAEVSPQATKGPVRAESTRRAGKSDSRSPKTTRKHRRTSQRRSLLDLDY